MTTALINRSCWDSQLSIKEGEKRVLKKAEVMVYSKKDSLDG